MSLSAESLKVFGLLFDSVQAAFDFVPRSPPPSPVARVRGALRNSRAIVKAMENQLETRDPKASDVDDLRRIREGLEGLIDDSWVADGMAETDLDWQSDVTVEAAGIRPPTRPLRLTGAIGILVEGLGQLES